MDDIERKLGLGRNSLVILFLFASCTINYNGEDIVVSQGTWHPNRMKSKTILV